jgi:hypothetical protein
VLDDVGTVICRQDVTRETSQTTGTSVFAKLICHLESQEFEWIKWRHQSGISFPMFLRAIGISNYNTSVILPISLTRWKTIEDIFFENIVSPFQILNTSFVNTSGMTLPFKLTKQALLLPFESQSTMHLIMLQKYMLNFGLIFIVKKLLKFLSGMQDTCRIGELDCQTKVNYWMYKMDRSFRIGMKDLKMTEILDYFCTMMGLQQQSGGNRLQQVLFVLFQQIIPFGCAVSLDFGGHLLLFPNLAPDQHI